MNSGLWATVISYTNSQNIDIQFDADGAIVEHLSWNNFIHGQVAHPSSMTFRHRRLHIGEIRQMNNSLNAMIEDYRSYNDIDVVFVDDGAKVVGTTYGFFKSGTIAHPNKKCQNSISLQEFAIFYYLKNFGFRKINQGEWKDRGFGKLELDFYNEANNIAIEFDGSVHAISGMPERDAYKNSKCHELGVKLYRLRVPQLPVLQDDLSINYILNKQNEILAGLIDCKNELEAILHANNIKFNDNDINYQRDVDTIIQKYRESCVDYYKNRRIGEKIYNPSYKQNMTIIDYRGATDVDVKFDDGSIRYNVAYREFKRANIRHPELISQELSAKRLGEIRKMNNGMEAEIIDYRIADDIDVKFLSDGAVRYGTTYWLFQQGVVKHPSMTPDALADNRLGKTGTNSCGEEMKIIAYRNADDMDILFISDGSIKPHVSYGDFQKGAVRHPSKTSMGLANQRLGEVRKMNNGMEARIVRYRSSKDIDVEFVDDGTIREHMLYCNFKDGRIQHQSFFPQELARQRVGERSTTRSGEQIVIVSYRSSTDVDVRFVSDGVVKEHVTYDNFKRGWIARPNAIT